MFLSALINQDRTINISFEKKLTRPVETWPLPVDQVPTIETGSCACLVICADALPISVEAARREQTVANTAETPVALILSALIAVSIFLLFGCVRVIRRALLSSTVSLSPSLLGVVRGGNSDVN